MNKLGWIAAGGIGVGFVSLALVAAVGANELKDFNFGGLTLDRLMSLSDACSDEIDPGVDPNATERTWTWDGGDEIEIAVPATVHYRGGEGDKVIARGSPKVLAHLHVRDGNIASSCNNRGRARDLDITLPGLPFRSIGLAGTGELDLQNITQPELDVHLAGSGTVRAQGKSERVEVAIAGSANAYLGALDVKRLELHIAGSGSAEAAPTEALDVSIAGSGTVRLLTRPAEISSSIMGSGRIIQPDGEVVSRNRP